MSEVDSVQCMLAVTINKIMIDIAVCLLKPANVCVCVCGMCVDSLSMPWNFSIEESIEY